jgi:hypothetical protein
MNTSIFLFLFFALIISGKILAKEVHLLHVTNNENQYSFKIVANIDEQTDTIKSMFKEDFQDDRKIQRERIELTKPTQTELLFIINTPHFSLDIKSPNLDNELGGRIILSTTKNQISGEKEDYEYSLAKSNEGWKIFYQNKIVYKLLIETNKKNLVGSVGIKGIYAID